MTIQEQAHQFLSEREDSRDVKFHLDQAQKLWDDANPNKKPKYFIYCTWGCGFSANYTAGTAGDKLDSVVRRASADDDEGYSEIWIDAKGNQYNVVPVAAALVKV